MLVTMAAVPPKLILPGRSTYQFIVADSGLV